MEQPPGGPAGQGRALWLSTIAFTVCFAVWTIFSIIGIQIKKDLDLSETQFGLLVGTPILTGSLIRLMLGIWTDQYGGRIVYTLVMLSAAVATWLLTYAYDYSTFLLAALGVGIAGGSFAVGIAYVSRWYSSERQSARRSPSSWRPSSWLPTAGRQLRKYGRSASPSWGSCSGWPRRTTRSSRPGALAASGRAAPGSSSSR
jgi:MFS family permease